MLKHSFTFSIRSQGTIKGKEIIFFKIKVKLILSELNMLYRRSQT